MGAVTARLELTVQERPVLTVSPERRLETPAGTGLHWAQLLLYPPWQGRRCGWPVSPPAAPPPPSSGARRGSTGGGPVSSLTSTSAHVNNGSVPTNELNISSVLFPGMSAANVYVTADGSLKIKAPTVENSGRYSCSAVNTVGAALARSHLTVFGTGHKHPGPGLGDVWTQYSGYRCYCCAH